MKLTITCNKSPVPDTNLSKPDFEIIKYLYDKEIERSRLIASRQTPVSFGISIFGTGTILIGKILFQYTLG